MTVVNMKTEPATRQAVLVITFTPLSDGEESVSETDVHSARPMTKLIMKQ